MRTLRRHFIWRIRKKCSQAEIFAHEVDCIPNARKQKNTNWDVPLTPHWKSNGPRFHTDHLSSQGVMSLRRSCPRRYQKSTITQMMAAKMVGMMATNKIYVQMNSSETKPPLPKLKKKTPDFCFLSSLFSSSLHPEQPRMFTKFKQSQGS